MFESSFFNGTAAFCHNNDNKWYVAYACCNVVLLFFLIFKENLHDFCNVFSYIFNSLAFIAVLFFSGWGIMTMMWYIVWCVAFDEDDDNHNNNDECLFVLDDEVQTAALTNAFLKVRNI